MPSDIDDCVASVLRDNPDMDESRAFAICNAAKNKGQLATADELLAAYNDDDHDLQAPEVFPFEDVDSCELDMDGNGVGDPREVCEALFQATDDTTMQTHITLADVQAPGDIERIEDGDTARYTDVLLLAPGVWGDAGSGRHVFYSPEGIANSADNWDDDTINLFHEQDNEVVEIGAVDTDSVFVDDDGNLYGDLVLSLDNDASRMADDLLMQSLETGGQKGIQGPSVELRGEKYDDSQHPPELLEGTFNGLGLVGLGVSPGPGSKDAAFAKQTRNRAVALASSDDVDVLTLQDNGITMDLDDIREQLEDRGIQLADDVDEETVATLAETFLQEDDDEEEEAESPDEDDESEDGEDMDGEEDDEEEEVEINLEDVADQVEANANQIGELNERVETIAEATETLQQGDIDLAELVESVNALSETVDERGERVDGLDERLSELSETLADPMSLADAGGVDSDEDDADIIVDEWGTYPTGSGTYAPRR